MKRTLIYSAVIATLFSAVASVGIAADKDRDQRHQSQDQVYGSQLMNQQERDDFRARMSAAKTGEERDQIRQAHYIQMKARAKQQGMTLPDEPPAQGMGSGGGMGGPGGGVGPGSRRMN
ncbi:MAG: hypothetical protein NUV55_10685 [Sulfuricaulis sp.]|uniref:hypothetical protein n=1 Tax=Sulfuricaulis sp. TaxID=2003553 RepID=UPI0025FB67ED|nr:hypothetical protein [Sulfuricaulis sp.]MCR4347648.1 hypothetical protein [Sulfuricaulis sp.]